MTDNEILLVVQAHKDGKKLQFRKLGNATWEECVYPPGWNFPETEYRVAPEPRKPKEWWITECGDGRYFLYDSPEPGVEGQVHVREVID